MELAGLASPGALAMAWEARAVAEMPMAVETALVVCWARALVAMGAKRREPAGCQLQRERHAAAAPALPESRAR